MLHEFSVENFRSIKERKTLCLQAQEIGEDIEGNVACELGYNILKSLSVYGANSSGKSNLLVAFSAMRIMVTSSAKLNEGEELFYRPFLLSETDNEPTLFEIVFTQSGYCYRYGFTYTLYKIEEEWLYRSTTPSSQEEMLFLRSLKEVETDNKLFAEGRDNEKRLNGNRLFLSLCAQLGGKISNSLMLWFSYSLNVISGLKSGNLPFYSRKWFAKDNDNRDKALEFFKKLQLGFENLAVRQKQIKISFTDEGVVNTLFSIHRTRAEYYPKYKVVAMNNLGFDMANFYKNDAQKLFEGLNEVIAANKELTKEEYKEKLDKYQKKLTQLQIEMFKAQIPVVIGFEG